MQYEITIGMEVHAELATKTKMFCGCVNAPFESEPNTNICPVCLGLPGTLPTMNARAVEWTVDLGADLGASIAPYTKWDRKSYFYPDLPKAYQLSQYDLPLLSGGTIEFRDGTDVVQTVRLTRIHLEEDTAKLIHDGARSLVDYNRAGVPLLELVSEPELHTAADAKAFCQTYQLMLQRRGIARADMEKGELRCEANISVRPAGQSALGTKVEVKNLNSFRSVERAITYEVERQIAVLESGGIVTQETRGWDDGKQVTFTQRKKETAADYRYFPDPDLPPVTPGTLWDLAAKARNAHAYPHEVARELMHEYGLSEPVATYFATNQEGMAVWAELVSECPGSDAAGMAVLQFATSLYVNTDTARALTVPQLLELATVVVEGKISKSQVREVIAACSEQGLEPSEAIRALGLEQVNDATEIEPIIDAVLIDHADAVAKYRDGKHETYGFLVGQVMKAAQGKANPGVVNEVLRKKLG